MTAGAILGVPIGGMTWAAVGSGLGAAVVLTIRAVMANHSFRGSFWGDLLLVAGGTGLLFGVPGLLVGAHVGGRVGRGGQPLLIGTLYGSWKALVATGSNPFLVLPCLFALAVMMVIYLADPGHYNGCEILGFGGIGLAGGWLVTLALWFRQAVQER